MNRTAPIASVYAHEARAQILTALRTPQFLVPSVLLPVMFYVLFGMAFSKGHVEVAHWLLATYAVFAAIAPSMFGFGAGVAAEREAGLIELKRVSPMPPFAYIAGKLAASLAATALAITGIGVAAAFAGVHMPAWRWAAVFGVGAASAVPFALIGLNLGLRMTSQGAVAGANVLFLLFCALGGLWVPLTEMPHWLTRVAWALPSFHLGQLSLGLAGAIVARNTTAHVAIVLVVTAAAAAGAWAAWRRDAA